MHSWRRDLPHSGWAWRTVDDLGDEDNGVSCEMCGYNPLRYVHTIHHDEAGFLKVGCVCAERLTGDEFTPSYREKALRSKASRLETLVRSPRWKRSANGNPYIKYQGIHGTIFCNRGGRWKFVVRKEFSIGSYRTESGAKRALAMKLIQLADDD